jgi:hypothetical protein
MLVQKICAFNVDEIDTRFHFQALILGTSKTCETETIDIKTAMQCLI